MSENKGVEWNRMAQNNPRYVSWPLKYTCKYALHDGVGHIFAING